MSSQPPPRWGTPAQASDRAGVPCSTIRRWAAEGRIPGRRIGPRKLEVDLNALDRMRSEPIAPGPWLTDQDRQLAREVAAALLPLTPEQREKLSLLLHPGREWPGRAAGLRAAVSSCRGLAGAAPSGPLRAGKPRGVLVPCPGG